MINIHAAKTRLSRLVARAEKGERIVIARNGKPVAHLGPAPKSKACKISPDDPLLNLETFATAGPGGKLTNQEIDRILYGRP
jgi:prevent-host-death family protein